MALPCFISNPKQEGAGGGGVISGLKEHLLSFSITEHVLNLIFLKKTELNGS